jgi:hypothetical protein
VKRLLLRLLIVAAAFVVVGRLRAAEERVFG